MRGIHPVFCSPEDRPMNRPAPTPPGATRHKPLTVLTVVAVVLAFAVLAFAPAKPQ